MFRILVFNTLIKKTDPETNETYLFGNERLVSGWEINARFKSEGIKGTVRHIRLVPNKLAANSGFARVGRALEFYWVRSLFETGLHTYDLLRGKISLIS